ncbi:MAG TPA: V-type ATPase subunit [bacterium]|jgi:V/A-type H+-transporting ATPase subunit C
MPDFPYINARVRAMKSRLLDAARIDELLALPSLDALIQALANSPYGREMQEALTRYTGLRAVDAALAQNFYRTTTKILSFADGKAKTLIELVLLRWDLANVRVLLRGKHFGVQDAQIEENLLPAGALSEAALKELLAAKDVPEVVGGLAAQGHPFAPSLAEALKIYQAAKEELFPLELALDRYYGTSGLTLVAGRGHNEQVVRGLLEADIDATNVKTALKLQQAGTLSHKEKLRHFVTGGRTVTEDYFLALSDPASMERGVRALGAAGFPVKGIGAPPTEFERQLDVTINRAQRALYLNDPLGIDIVIAYVAMKYNEVVNLRLVARSKALGISRDRVRKEMVGV